MKKYTIYIVVFVLVILGYLSYTLSQRNIPATDFNEVKSYKIGFFALGDKDIQNENLIGFKKQLEKMGLKEGENVSYVVEIGDRNIKGDLTRAAKKLNDASLDIILTGATTATEELKKLPDLKTRVYFLSVARPESVVESLTAPEGLITGMADGTVLLAGKRLEFLKELVPGIKRVGSVIEKGHTTAQATRAALTEAAKKLNIEMVFVEIEPGKHEQVFEKLKLMTRANRIDGYVACTCVSNERYSKELIEHFRKEKIPAVIGEREIGAKLGWLATYSNDREKAGIAAAQKVYDILNGMPISKVPVILTLDILFELNSQTAQIIGVTIPQALLVRANKVYNE